MPIASLFRSAACSWRSLSAVLLASVAAAFAQSPSAADGFDPNVDGNVYAIALQPDGKLILAGQFAQVRPNGTPGDTRNNLARLNLDGTLDTSFDPNFNGPVRTVVLQPDGKILVGGDFTTVKPNGAASATTRNRVARLNADGSLDAGFDPNLGGALQTQVYAILRLTSGQIVVGGTFTTVQANGAASATTRNRIARFNADGSLDTAFDPSANNIVFALAQHYDGKIIVAGGFTSFSPANGETTTRNRIARLNANGTVDSEFNPNLDNRATSLAVQRDGKILVGGDFATVQPPGNDTAIAHSRLVRLNPDGTVDMTFTGNASGNVAAIAVHPDGSIMAGGAFTTVWSAGSSIAGRPYVARFKPDGTVDLTFSAGANAIVDAFAFQPDGKLVIAGYFTGAQPAGSTGATLRNRVARLNPNGSLDATFNLDAAGRPLVEAMQADGKIIIGGSFTSVGGATHNRLARLNPDGSVDSSFSPDFNGLVLSIAIQPDQKIVVGGTFTTIGGETRNYLARLNPSGTIDSEFNPNPNGQVASVALQSDGKIVIGGSFTFVQPIGAATSSSRPYSARINANGSLDPAFHPNTDSTVNVVAVQADGKVLLGGVFTSVTPNVDLTPITTTTNGTTTTTYATGGVITARNALVRINADGSLDTAYDPNPNSTVTAIALQPDGKAVIGGSFVLLRPNGATTSTTRNFIARINTDGTVDTGFDPKANNSVLSLARQADGKILVGGPFTTFTPNGATDYTLRKYAARLNADGTLDSTFNLDVAEINGTRIDSWFVQPDGKILMAGNFVSLQPIGAPARVVTGRLVRLNAAGTIDSTFLPGVGGAAGGQINTLILQPDGKLIAAGAFGEIGGGSTKNIARFNPEGTPDTSFTAGLSADGPINAVVIRPGATAVPPQSKGFAWLNDDGSLRASFAPDVNSRISGVVNAFVVQPDGAVVVGGAFTTATGIPGPNLVRFAPNGAIDTNFGPSPNGAVAALAIQSDGKILVGGSFSTIAGADRAYVARLNTDGTIDTGFNPVASARVNAIVVQADANIILGGQFTTLNPNATTTTTVTTTTTTPNAPPSTNTTTAANGAVTTTTVSTVDGTTTTTVTVVSSTPVARAFLARVKIDGTLDTGYNPTMNGNVNALVLQADGKLVAGGSFSDVQPGGAGTITQRNGMARINSDGTLDTGYDPSPNGNVNALALYVDGKIIVGGAFTDFAPNNGGTTTQVRNYLGRLNTDGSLDTNFDPKPNGIVQAVAVQPVTGKVIFGGVFTTVQPNGATAASGRNNVARANFDGSLDTSFNPNANAAVSAVASSPDGSVLVGGSFNSLQPNPPLVVGGSFNTIGGVASRNLALLGDDGSASSVFQPNPDGAVNALLVQADGKIVVAGAFTNIAGVARNRLMRFNADFSVDTGYNPNLGATVNTIALQADGKVIAGGVGLLKRINTDGSADGTFSAPQDTTYAVAIQSDGRLLIDSGSPRTVRRLNANGSLDGTFANATTTGTAGSQLRVLQADGRIIVAGTTGGSVTSLLRLNTDGSLDNSFNPAVSGVSAAVLQTDGRLVIGGSFTSVGGLARGSLARLSASTVAVQAVTATTTSAVWARSGGSPELSSAIFEKSTDATTWTTLGSAGRVSGTANWQLSGLSLPSTGLFYLRVRGVAPSSVGTSAGIIEASREFNLSAVAGVGPAGSSVPTLEVGGLLIDSATGLIAGEVAASPGSVPATSATSIGEVARPAASTAVEVGDSRLINLSARARVSGDGALITGFVITGSQPHTVLLRAAGPSLGAFAVTDVLATPRLQLFNSAGQVILENHGWTTTPASGMPELVAAMTRTGAFPFTAGSGADAAAVVTLDPGAYSMWAVDNAHGTGGVTLAEVYDAGSASDTSRLVNISLRGDVNAGSGAFISGFVLAGNAPKRLLVRGTGPGLAKFNVPGTIADPVVSVFNVSGQLIRSNDNWSLTTSDGSLSADKAAHAVGAFALDPGSKDAAVTMTLVPGTYTVQVSGAGSATGAALIEVYELP